MAIDLDDLIHRREYTGKPGRQKGSGSKDTTLLYNMCKRLAADETLSWADAARQVADAKDYNAFDRLPKKLRKCPNMLEAARAYRERQIQRFIENTRGATVELTIMGVRSKRSLIQHVSIRSMVFDDTWSDPRVIRAIDNVWRRVRPTTVETMIWEARTMYDRLFPKELFVSQYVLDELRWQREYWQRGLIS